jgi:hypothetical protein
MFKLKYGFLGALLFSGSFLCTAHAALPLPETHTQSLVFDSYGEAEIKDLFLAISGKPNYSFLSIFNFAVKNSSDFDSGFVSISSKNKDLSFTGFDLYNEQGSRIQYGTQLSVGSKANEADSWALSFSNLLPNNYSLKVSGNVVGTSGGTFVGTAILSPVPEPTTLGMMLGGLAIVGFALARQNKSVGTVAV